MKERQRWQPEEDALLKAYVKQYGPKEWNLISQRMNKPLHRDSKSCLERWKNYLKPGIKKGSLTVEEQNLVISLQSKYGNKWKKIASQVPGRTAKRLGKWWEVFKEKQLKLRNQQSKRLLLPNSAAVAAAATTVTATSTSTGTTTEEVLQTQGQGKYDHILETFAEKYVQPKFRSQSSLLLPSSSSSSTATSCSHLLIHNLSFPESVPPPPGNSTTTAHVLSLGCSIPTSTDVPLASSSVLPPWMSAPSIGTSLSSSSSTTPSPSVSLTLSASEPPLQQQQQQQQQSTGIESVNPLFLSVHQMGTLVQYSRELEEGRQNWVQHKKEATWRLSRLEQQLDSEKARRKTEIIEDLEAKIRCLREEEMSYFDIIENECREQLNAIQRDAETQEAKMVEICCNKQVKLAKIVEQMGSFHHQSI